MGRVFVVLSMILALASLAQAGSKEEQQAKLRAGFERLISQADGGDVKAMRAGALVLLEGKYVEKDPARGIGLLERAAAIGDTGAIVTLYDIYEHGRYGVPKDPERADDWAEKGGIPSPRIRAKQEKLLKEELRRQAGEGSKAAASVLALSDRNTPDIKTLEKNARAGDTLALGVLFDLHMKGKYTPTPGVEKAMERCGLMTRAKQEVFTSKAQGK